VSSLPLDVLRALRQPGAALPGQVADEQLQDTLNDLASEAALQSIDRDAYWPKWDSPWWRFSLLEEMGMVQTASQATLEHLAQAVLAVPERRFPVPPAPDIDPLQAFCHCSLGNLYRILASSGRPMGDFDWVLGWFRDYQMADGGYNCDETAYAASGECPSSMVATVAALEAAILHPQGAEVARRAAHCLLGRELRMGSNTEHNREERASESKWLQLAFPRFYHYDVLRGLEAVTRWALAFREPLAWSSLQWVVESLLERFPAGVVAPERRAYEHHRSRFPDGSRGPARSFALLEAISQPGLPSAPLTAQWNRVRGQLVELHDSDLLGA